MIERIVGRLLLSGEPSRVAYRWNELAGYNARVAQGIVHTPEYVERMREQQEMFDREMRDVGTRV